MAKKLTAIMSTKYPRMPGPCGCRIAATFWRMMRRLIVSCGLWQDSSRKGLPSHGRAKTRDRQQELFVMVDAAMAGAARQCHRLRRGVHPALYRQQGGQGPHPRLYALRQGSGADRRRCHDLGFACDPRIPRGKISRKETVAAG